MVIAGTAILVLNSVVYALPATRSVEKDLPDYGVDQYT
jgi:hypothetical protein